MGSRGKLARNLLKPRAQSLKPYNILVLQEPRFLSAEQFLLTTLIVKLAIMAVLATMLARYHRFRHILIFERRGWLDRLVFALAIGLPLMAGVTFRLLLNYNAADLTLEGAFLAGLIAGPYACARRIACLPADAGRERLPTLCFDAGSRRWLARGVPEGSDLAFRRSCSSTAEDTDGWYAARTNWRSAAARALARSSCAHPLGCVQRERIFSWIDSPFMRLSWPGDRAVGRHSARS